MDYDAYMRAYMYASISSCMYCTYVRTSTYTTYIEAASGRQAGRQAALDTVRVIISEVICILKCSSARIMIRDERPGVRVRVSLTK
jgi:xanthine/uracil/vitamin C permease (AzgA family)